jgi:hypothetical protein
MRQFRLLPDVHTLKVVSPLVFLIMLDLYREQDREQSAAQGTISELVDILRALIRHVTHWSILRLWRKAARALVERLGTRVMMALMRKTEPSSVHNVRELAMFFKQDPDVRQRTIQALVYLNRDRADLHQLTDQFVGLHRHQDRVSDVVADLILDGNGIHHPERARAAIQALLYEFPDRDCGTLTCTAYSWWTIVDRKPKGAVTEADVDLLRSIVTRWMEIDIGPLCGVGPERERMYGYVFVHGRPYPHYPLAYYAAVWTKAYPGQPVDLLEHYARRAERENDLALKLHIIDTFGDFRQVFYDYPTALRVLTPYIRMLTEPAASETEQTERERISEHLVNALGHLRGLQQDEVDAFLDETDAPEDLIEEIRCHSYLQPMIGVYFRFYQFMVDLVAYAPTEFVEQLIAITRDAFETESLGAMFAVLVNGLIDLAEAPSPQAEGE